jgi:hypothetical protein
VVIIKGFNAQPVPSYEKMLPGPVPEGKGKHAPEALEAFLPPFFVGMENDLGIRLTGKTVALVPQGFPQFKKIIDLPVKNQLERPLFVGQGLSALFGEVDNGETAMPQSDPFGSENSALVRSPVLHDLVAFFGDRDIRPGKTTNSAHSVENSLKEVGDEKLYPAMYSR